MNRPRSQAAQGNVLGKLLGFLFAIAAAELCLAAPGTPIPGLSSSDTWVLSALAFIVLLLLNGAYIAAETAVGILRTTHVRHVRDDQSREGRQGKQADLLQDLIRGRQQYVTTCLLASRLSRLGLFMVVLLVSPNVAAAVHGVEPAAVQFADILPLALLIGLPVLLLNLLVGELVPRSYATLHPHLVGLRLYGLIRLAAFVLSVPASVIVATADLLTKRFGGKAAFGQFGAAEEEIKNLVESAEETGEIESGERELIHSVLDFNDTVAREIMTPRVDMDALPVKSRPDELLKVIEDTGHSRIPLYEDTDDQIVGVIHAKDLLLAMAKDRPFTLRELMRPALFIPEGKILHELLHEMRATRSQMAILQDEFGGTAGIVTTEDIVEQLVGEIVDEYDEEEVALQQTDQGWHVSGKTHVDDVNDAMGSDFDKEEFDTIGGLVFGHFGRQPKVGEEILIDDYRFTVEETNGRRIRRLRIEPPELSTSETSIAS